MDGPYLGGMTMATTKRDERYSEAELDRIMEARRAADLALLERLAEVESSGHGEDDLCDDACDEAECNEILGF
jgi:hypothetical protein